MNIVTEFVLTVLSMSAPLVLTGMICGISAIVLDLTGK